MSTSPDLPPAPLARRECPADHVAWVPTGEPDFCWQCVAEELQETMSEIDGMIGETCKEYKLVDAVRAKMAELAAATKRVGELEAERDRNFRASMRDSRHFIDTLAAEVTRRERAEAELARVNANYESPTS